MLESAFKVVVLHFVEAIHVELSDKAVNLFVTEISWKNNLLELNDIFDDELETIVGPVYYLLVLLDLDKTRTTPRISKVL